MRLPPKGTLPRTLWDEFILLRRHGLTPAHVERYAPTFLGLDEIHGLWARAAESRGAIGCDWLVARLDDSRFVSNSYARAAFDIDESIPPPRRSSLTTRRAFVADRGITTVSNVRSHEDSAIWRLITDLVPSAALTTAQSTAKSSWPPTVELMSPGGRWLPVDVREIKTLPNVDRRFSIVNQTMVNRYDADGRLVSQHRAFRIRSEVDGLRIRNYLINYPTLAVSRLRLQHAGCNIGDIASHGNYLSLVLDFGAGLSAEEERDYSFSVDLDASGVAENYMPFQNAYPVTELTMRAEFVGDSPPRGGWWWDETPYESVPNVPLPGRLLESSGDPTAIEHTFRNRDVDALTCGIAWSWEAAHA